MKEIERKFLVKKIPDEKYLAEIEIIQFYICSNDDKIVRVRKIGDKYNVGFKKGGGLVRLEKEIEISRQDFEDLSAFESKNRIAKTRYLYDLDDYTAELDVFAENLEGLVVVEVEFPNAEEAKKFTPPDWFGKEITTDYRYTNSYLSETQKIPE